MNEVSIPANASAKAILEANRPPRGATHFRYTEGRRRPVIAALKNIGCLAGCAGHLEFGKASFEGRGRHAKIKEFHPMGQEAPAAQPAPEAGGEPAAPKGRKNKVLGHSACAVAKALGAAGVKWEEADRILRARGVEMPKASLSVQLGFGRNQATWEKRGEPAPLTAEQIAELRAGEAA